nr:hypothetical protein [Sediminibacillus dalangtanensis]
MEYYKYLRQFIGHRPLILPGYVVIILNEQNQVLLQKYGMEVGDCQAD